MLRWVARVEVSQMRVRGCETIIGLERVVKFGDGDPRIRRAGVHGVARAHFTDHGEGVVDARVDERLHKANVLSVVPC